VLHFNQINIQASIKIQNRKHVNVEISQDLYHNESPTIAIFFRKYEKWSESIIFLDQNLSSWNESLLQAKSNKIRILGNNGRLPAPCVNKKVHSCYNLLLRVLREDHKRWKLSKCCKNLWHQANLTSYIY